mmetsp:Transcript_115535/g.367352  ORF Transcript_115535/g.367352 Transcript_115535/m.367352 type:complete len:313 (-) Transcript_115535:270-1208(-)
MSCSEPPAFLPDFFASEPAPRTWPNVAITLVGVAFCGYMLANSVIEWIADPVTTSVELSSIAGQAFDITIVCRSALGCHVEHQYNDVACARAVTATATSTLRQGQQLVAKLCASPLYADGLLIGVPLGAVALSAAVEVMSGGALVGLPPATLLASVSSTSNPTAVGVALTTSTKIDGTSTPHWSFTQQVASCDSRCAAPTGGGSIGGIISGIGVASDTLGSLCYQLRIGNTATTITQVRAFTWVALFEAWGGAYGFVFGLIGMFIFWLEQLTSLCCCCGRPRAKVYAENISDQRDAGDWVTEMVVGTETSLK